MWFLGRELILADKQQYLCQELVETVEREIFLYKDLQSLLKQEYASLVDSDLDKVKSNNQLKEALLKAIDKKEKERLGWVRRLSIYFSMSQKEPSMEELSKVLPAPYDLQIKEMREYFKSIIEEVKEQNISNDILANNALQTVESSIEIMKSVLQGGQTYKSKGKIDNKKEQQKHIISKKA